MMNNERNERRDKEFKRVMSLSPDVAEKEFFEHDFNPPVSWSEGIYLIMLMCAMFPSVNDATSFMEINPEYLYRFISCVGNQWQAILNAGMALISAHHTTKVKSFFASKGLRNIFIPTRTITEQEETFWSMFFFNHNISEREFFDALHKWIFMTDTKKNTLWLYGPPNSGKSFLAAQIIHPFEKSIGVISNQGILNEFALSHLLQSSLLLWEEPFTDVGVAQDMKNVLGGKPIAVPMKYNVRQVLNRKPILITSNYEDLTQGVNASFLELDALNKRRFMFTMTYKPIFNFQVPADSLWQYLLTK